MTTGQILFYGGIALFALALILMVVFAIVKPKYKPDNAVYSDGGGSETPANRPALRREPTPSDAASPEHTYGVSATEHMVQETEVLPATEHMVQETEVLPATEYMVQETEVLPATEYMVQETEVLPATEYLPQETESQIQDISPAFETVPLQTEVLEGDEQDKAAPL